MKLGRCCLCGNFGKLREISLGAWGCVRCCGYEMSKEEFDRRRINVR